jgi:hypothetical protein
MSEEPYITAEVSFLATADGGRKGPTAAAGRYGCPMRIDGDDFDVRIDLAETGSIRPGQTLTVTLRFLSPDRAIPRLTVGKRFLLREARTIAVGKVLSIHVRA